METSPNNVFIVRMHKLTEKALAMEGKMIANMIFSIIGDLSQLSQKQSTIHDT